MLTITDIAGNTEALTDYNIRERKRVVNGEYSLSFSVSLTERNGHSFPLVQEESIVEYDGQEYRIKKLREYMKGKSPIKEITALHTFFDIIDDHQYDKLSGTINIVQALTHVFSVTDWTWVNQGAFASVEFENFGDDNPLALFKTILERYGAEFEITGHREITLKNQIGTIRDAQFRYKHNIKTLYKDIDSTNVSTFIKGFGKGIEAEYTSPNATVYGIRHAPPVRNESFSIVANLQEHLQKVLVDTPNMVIGIEVVELKNQGIPIDEYELGDTIFLIHEDIGIDSTVRILEYTDYPESFKSPSVVLANFKKTMTDTMVSFHQTSKTVKQLTDVDGNISLAVKRLYRNSNHYSDHTGDWYISLDDPNAYVHIGAGGLDVHKGLVRVEREDGYATLIGGIIQHGFAIQGSEPPFQGQGIEKYGQFYRNMTNNRFDNIQRFTFKHDSRYIHINASMFTDNGETGYITFDLIYDGTNEIALSTTATENRWSNMGAGEQGYFKDIIFDLGVPDGQIKMIYWRMYGSTGTNYVYGAVRYIVQEG